MVEAKLLELISADAEGDDLYEKYAKSRQKSKRQSIRLSIITGADQNGFHSKLDRWGECAHNLAKHSQDKARKAR